MLQKVEIKVLEIITLVWLNGLVVWFSLWVREAPGSSPGWALKIYLRLKTNFKTQKERVRLKRSGISITISYIHHKRYFFYLKNKFNFLHGNTHESCRHSKNADIIRAGNLELDFVEPAKSCYKCQ